MSVIAYEMSRGVFFDGLSAIAAEHGRRVDARLVQQQFLPPYTLDAMVRAAASLGIGLEIRGFRHDPPNVRRCLIVLAGDALDADQDAGSSPEAVGDGSAAGFGTGAESPRRVALGLFDPQSQSLRPLGVAGNAAVGLSSVRHRLLGLALIPDPATAHLESAESAASDRIGLAWFMAALGRHRRVWGEVLVASLFVQVLALAMPLITQVMLDKVIAHQAMSTLWVLAVAMLLVIAFSGALAWARQQLVLHAGLRIDAELGERAFSHLLGLPLRWFERRPTGAVLARIQGIESIREFLSGAMVTIALDLPFAAVFLAIMFWYSWQLTLVVLVLLLLLTGLSLAAAPLLRKRLNRQFHAGAGTQAVLTEFIANMESVKALQLEPQLRDRYRSLLGEYLHASAESRRLSGTLSVLAGVLEQSTTAIVLCAGAWLVMQNSGFTIGMLIAFQMFSSRLAQPLLRMTALWQEFQQASIALSRLDDLLRVPTEPADVALRHAGARRGHISIDNLGFRYAANLPPVIEGLSLDLPPGQCALITGPSGAGKSTLTRLLLGFHAADAGVIRIDGCDIATMPANELRSHFGVIMQDPVLFAGTVLDNLEFANPGVTMEEVVAACGMAGIHDVINALPEGYQSRVGEHGAGLSGGQRQRIAIARALLRRPLVLICDEAVSHLDARAAADIVQTLNGLRGKVSVVFIAHEAPAGLHVDAGIALQPERMRKVA